MPKSSKNNPIGVFLQSPIDSVTFINLFFIFLSLKIISGDLWIFVKTIFNTCSSPQNAVCQHSEGWNEKSGD